ncbi:Zinc/iron permease [Mycena amicta]|nr:Zinc/iron permease [Mycena amicta]
MSRLSSSCLLIGRSQTADAVLTVISSNTCIPSSLTDLDADSAPKIYAIFGIFFLSLFAVSFPGISKRSRILRIPHVAFFIGKHFGTGVILSTAFCHLLQDSFEHLQNPILKKAYPRVGSQTGLIILSSLLLIFFVEYISTSYVDFLHADPSAPPSPANSAPPSPRPHSPHGQPQTAELNLETTPLLVSVHPKSNPVTPTYLAAILAPPRHCPLSRHDGRLLSVCVTTANQDPAPAYFPHEEHVDVDAESEPDTPREERHTVGRGRQIVGIIVLELGIMLHSLVIGLTLALTTGSDFTSLLTAIVFHQLFEGHSLGIRIASLPHAKSKPHHRDWFSITLSLLFALTTPVGLAVGVLAFNAHVESIGEYHFEDALFPECQRPKRKRTSRM